MTRHRPEQARNGKAETRRILEIGNYPPPYCGWSVRTKYLARALRDAGAECEVLDIGPARKQRREGCMDVQNGWDYLKKLVRHARRGYRFHAHVNGDSPKGFLLTFAALVVGALTGRRAILTFHAGVDQRFFPRRSLPFRILFSALFRLPAGVVCNSEPVRREILKYADRPDRVHAIPAFSRQYLAAAATSGHEDVPEGVREFAEAHSRLIVCYAYDRPEFRLRQLVDVFRDVVADDDRPPGLLIVGDEGGYPEVEARVGDVGIEEHVSFTGNLPRPQFVATLDFADLYLRTHLRDGVSSSVLEAVSAGTPVLAAANETRPPEVVTYRGEDPQDLTRALREMLKELRTNGEDQLDSTESPGAVSGVRDTLSEEVRVVLRGGTCDGLEPTETVEASGLAGRRR